jgi:hypothetical protein
MSCYTAVSSPATLTITLTDTVTNLYFDLDDQVSMSATNYAWVND